MMISWKWIIHAPAYVHMFAHMRTILSDFLLLALVISHHTDARYIKIQTDAMKASQNQFIQTRNESERGCVARLLSTDIVDVANNNVMGQYDGSKNMFGMEGTKPIYYKDRKRVFLFMSSKMQHTVMNHHRPVYVWTRTVIVKEVSWKQTSYVKELNQVGKEVRG